MTTSRSIGSPPRHGPRLTIDRASGRRTEARRDLPAVLPLVLERPTDSSPDRPDAAGRALDQPPLLGGQRTQPLDERRALSAETIADVDPVVVDRVPGRGELLDAAEHARDVVRLGLADVPEDPVERAAALRLGAQTTVVDSLDQREQICARPLQPRQHALQVLGSQGP